VFAESYFNFWMFMECVQVAVMLSVWR